MKPLILALAQVHALAEYFISSHETLSDAGPDLGAARALVVVFCLRLRGRHDMAKNLGRMKWTDSGADFVSAAPRAGTALRQITDPAPPAQKSTQESQDARDGPDVQKPRWPSRGARTPHRGEILSHRAKTGGRGKSVSAASSKTPTGGHQASHMQVRGLSSPAAANYSTNWPSRHRRRSATVGAPARAMWRSSIGRKRSASAGLPPSTTTSRIRPLLPVARLSLWPYWT
jgi:hypothetical protein